MFFTGEEISYIETLRAWNLTFRHLLSKQPLKSGGPTLQILAVILLMLDITGFYTCTDSYMTSSSFLQE